LGLTFRLSFGAHIKPGTMIIRETALGTFDAQVLAALGNPPWMAVTAPDSVLCSARYRSRAKAYPESTHFPTKVAREFDMEAAAT